MIQTGSQDPAVIAADAETRLQDAEETCEVLFLFFCEPNPEAAIVEANHFDQIACGTIGKVGCAGGESAELLHQD